MPDTPDGSQLTFSTVHAVALDANVMSGGRLSLSVVREIVETLLDRELDAEVWIPEPVVWEWAEHAHSDLRGHAEKHGALKRALDGAGLGDRLPELPEEVLDIDTVVRDIEDNLLAHDGLRILRLHDQPGAAFGGLRDQVLQVGAGRTKGGSGNKAVKTGAADGASCRLVEIVAGGELAHVALISGDQDVERYFRGRPAPAIFRSWPLLRAELISLRPRDEVQSEEFATVVREVLVSSSPPALPETFEARNAAAQEFLSSEHFLETTMSFGAIRSVRHIDDIEISEDGTFATAVVSADVDVELTGVSWNDVDDELEQDHDLMYDVPAQLNIEARLRGGVWSFDVVDGSILE